MSGLSVETEELLSSELDSGGASVLEEEDELVVVMTASVDSAVLDVGVVVIGDVWLLVS